MHFCLINCGSVNHKCGTKRLEKFQFLKVMVVELVMLRILVVCLLFEDLGCSFSSIQESSLPVH